MEQWCVTYNHNANHFMLNQDWSQIPFNLILLLLWNNCFRSTLMVHLIFLTLKYVYKITNAYKHWEYLISVSYCYFTQYTMQLYCNGQTEILCLNIIYCNMYSDDGFTTNHSYIWTKMYYMAATINLNV